MLFAGQTDGDGGGSNTIFQDCSPPVYNAGCKDQTVSYSHCYVEYPPILSEGYLLLCMLSSIRLAVAVVIGKIHDPADDYFKSSVGQILSFLNKFTCLHKCFFCMSCKRSQQIPNG